MQVAGEEGTQVKGKPRGRTEAALVSGANIVKVMTDGRSEELWLVTRPRSYLRRDKRQEKCGGKSYDRKQRPRVVGPTLAK